AGVCPGALHPDRQPVRPAVRLFLLAREPGPGAGLPAPRQAGAGGVCEVAGEKNRRGPGTLPPVPWILAAVVLAAPLAMLALVAPKIALLLIPLALMTPILY